MSAIFSPCRLHRVRLEREVQLDGIVVAMIGVNPSTADATVNDPTITREVGFAKVHGWRRIIKGNVFSFRSTDIKGLRGVLDHRHEENREHLIAIVADADMVVPCWGSRDKLPPALRPQLDATLALLRSTGKPLMCFGLTGSGDPKHPLRLAYRTPLVAL